MNKLFLMIAILSAFTLSFAQKRNDDNKHNLIHEQKQEQNRQPRHGQKREQENRNQHHEERRSDRHEQRREPGLFNNTRWPRRENKDWSHWRDNDLRHSRYWNIAPGVFFWSGRNYPCNEIIINDVVMVPLYHTASTIGLICNTGNEDCVYILSNNRGLFIEIQEWQNYCYVGDMYVRLDECPHEYRNEIWVPKNLFLAFKNGR